MLSTRFVSDWPVYLMLFGMLYFIVYIIIKNKKESSKENKDKN